MHLTNTRVCMPAQLLSHVWLSASSRTVAHQAPLSMGLYRQEYYSGLPPPTPGDLPDRGVKPVSPASPAVRGGFFNHWANSEAISNRFMHLTNNHMPQMWM